MFYYRAMRGGEALGLLLKEETMLETLQSRKEALQAQGKKGFTLMEMLIVIAIIAVLVAIAIPVLGAQLENAKESTDAANIRSAYAIASVKAMQDGKDIAAGPVNITQDTAGWTSDVKDADIAGKDIGTDTVLSTVKSGDTVYVNVSKSGVVTFTKGNGETGFDVVNPVNGN